MAMYQNPKIGDLVRFSIFMEKHIERVNALSDIDRIISLDKDYMVRNVLTNSDGEYVQLEGLGYGIYGVQWFFKVGEASKKVMKVLYEAKRS